MLYTMTTTPDHQKRADAANFGRPACTCGVIHYFAQVKAVGRFEPSGPTGYVAKGHPVRSTREEAMRDVCEEWTE